ncbi:MAG TPA: hypothetical protein VHA78_05850 [Candidatus Peribacteraceae bacterium]|nr:hypothetical protein [Candidatus Peribacteraceae bacterium]
MNSVNHSSDSTAAEIATAAECAASAIIERIAADTRLLSADDMNALLRESIGAIDQETRREVVVALVNHERRASFRTMPHDPVHAVIMRLCGQA